MHQKFHIFETDNDFVNSMKRFESISKAWLRSDEDLLNSFIRIFTMLIR